MQREPGTFAKIRRESAERLRESGFAILDNDQLGQILGGDATTLSRAELMCGFAAQIGARLERWDERGVLLTRISDGAQR